MDIGPVRRVVKVEPEPFPLGHPENAPEEPSRREIAPPVEVPASAGGLAVYGLIRLVRG